MRRGGFTSDGARISLLMIALIVSAPLAVARGEMKVEPLVVGPARNDVTYVISPKGGHVAAGAMKGSRFVVMVDGVEGPKFDSVMMIIVPAALPSPPDPKVGLPGYQEERMTTTPVVFSRDGKRYAYVARAGQE